MSDEHAAISTATAEHYVWAAACDGWHLVKRAGEMSVIQERMPPHTSEARHYHRDARQFFFVLRGIATMDVGERTEVLLADHGIEVAPGVAHQIRNESDAPLEFLLVSVPPSHGDRVAVMT